MKSREFSVIRYETLVLTDEFANVLGDETTLYKLNFLMLRNGKKQYVLISSENLENLKFKRSYSSQILESYVFLH